MVTIVIFANTQTKKQALMINTLLLSVDKKYETIIFEQSDYVHFKGKTLHKNEPFNFNKFCNDAVKISTSDLVLICNNDLEPEDGWIEALVSEVNKGNLVVSSFEPYDARQKRIKSNQSGYNCGEHFSGWCFMLHKKAWEMINGFDEDFSFWCADNAFLEQLKLVGIVPMLVYDSRVRHLKEQTLSTVKNRDELTRVQVKKFNRKYNQNLFNYGK